MIRFRETALGVFVLAVGCANLPRRAAERTVDRWSPPSAAAARRLLGEYGVPDNASPNKLTWYGKGAWRRTVVLNRPRVYGSARDFDLIEQTVAYPVTREQAAELVAFSGALIVNVDRGELTSRATTEEINRLNLNLADEVIRGARSPRDAQLVYRRVIELSAAGKSSPYTSALRFGGR